MSARSLHLARALIAKLSTVEEGLIDDAGGVGIDARVRRQEAVAKVLLSEEGIEDFATVGLVLSAMPRVRADVDPTDREVGELAEFLERQLVLSK